LPWVVSYEEISADRRHAIGKVRRARVNRPDPDSDRVRPCQHEIYVTTATQPGWNQPDQPACAARLG
jgi:hypothetical protein